MNRWLTVFYFYIKTKSFPPHLSSPEGGGGTVPPPHPHTCKENLLSNKENHLLIQIRPFQVSVIFKNTKPFIRNKFRGNIINIWCKYYVIILQTLPYIVQILRKYASFEQIVFQTDLISCLISISNIVNNCTNIV